MKKNKQQKYWFQTDLAITKDLKDYDILEWYDGPLMYYRKINGEYYFYLSADRKKEYDIWLVIKTNKNNLLDLMNCNVTLNDFYDRHKQFYEYRDNVPDEPENFEVLSSMPDEYRCTDDHHYLFYGEVLSKLKQLKIKSK